MDELILMAQAGDEDAFTKMILYIKDDLYKIAKTRIANETDIEDAIQETMIETYKSIKNMAPTYIIDIYFFIGSFIVSNASGINLSIFFIIAIKNII